MAWTTPRTWTDTELVTAAMMNPHIRDNLNASSPHLIARKSGDESLASNTTLQDDDDLILPSVAANEVWRFEFIILFTGSASGDLKVAFTFPSGGTFTAIGPGLDASGVWDILSYLATTSPTTARVYNCPSTTIPAYLHVGGVYLNGGTAGNVTLQWAQGTSNATATVVKANSTLYAVKLI